MDEAMKNKIVNTAREKMTNLCADNLDMDAEPKLSVGEEGTWVAAWVWVAADEIATDEG